MRDRVVFFLLLTAAALAAGAAVSGLLCWLVPVGVAQGFAWAWFGVGIAVLGMSAGVVLAMPELWLALFAAFGMGWVLGWGATVLYVAASWPGA